MARLKQRNGRGLPITEMAALAAALPAGCGVTIDLDAVRDLGEPLVVLRPQASPRRESFFASLSRREREVAILLARGLTNKEIARSLDITVATAKDHVHRSTCAQHITRPK